MDVLRQNDSRCGTEEVRVGVSLSRKNWKGVCDCRMKSDQRNTSIRKETTSGGTDMASVFREIARPKVMQSIGKDSKELSLPRL
jgi:hypothetical protein